MLTREQILERLSALDITADEWDEIEADVRENHYPLKRYKQMVTAFTVGLDANSTEDALALLARHFFTMGYMEGIGDVANEVADIIVASR